MKDEGGRMKAIPPTAVGGCFKSNLQNRRSISRQIPPTAVGGYVQVQPTKEGLHLPANTTNGSWWIVQVQPTKQRQLPSANTTNGSWWMVSSPTYETGRSISRQIPPTAVGGCFKSNLQSSANSTPQIPPTAVGGIWLGMECLF